jgi:hypothetical protein
MKKVMAILILNLIISLKAFGEILTVTAASEDGSGTETVKIDSEPQVCGQRRFYIERHEGELWLIEQARTFDAEKNKWTDWQIKSENPALSFYIVSNSSLDNWVSELYSGLQAGIIIGSHDDGNRRLVIAKPNKNGFDVWWEEKKYVNYLLEYYSIIE